MFAAKTVSRQKSKAEIEEEEEQRRLRAEEERRQDKLNCFPIIGYVRVRNGDFEEDEEWMSVQDLIEVIKAEIRK